MLKYFWLIFAVCSTFLTELFFSRHTAYFQNQEMYIYVQICFLNTNNQFAKVSILFTIFINLSSHTL